MQPSNSQQALSQLQSYQSGRKKPQDILRESEQNLGIPTATQRQVGLRGAITNTETLLKNVDPSVSGRTSGSLVTDAQKNRLIALEREPIAGQLTEQNRSLENENANVAELSRRALQDAQLAISADDTEQNRLQGLYGTLYQREQDEVGRLERERAFKLQQEEARRSSASQSALANYLASLNTPEAPAQQPQAPQQSLEQIFGTPQQQSKQPSTPIQAPKLRNFIPAVFNPGFLPSSISRTAVDFYNSNQDVKDKVTNFGKGLFNKARSLF